MTDDIDAIWLGTKSLHAERNASVYRMHKGGASYHECASAHGISPENARNIVAKTIALLARQPIGTTYSSGKGRGK